MKKQETPFTQDVEELLEKATVEEAAADVLSRFERAVDCLDQESKELFRLFLDGKTIPELSQTQNLSEGQLGEWLASIKREVIQQLRVNVKVRH